MSQKSSEKRFAQSPPMFNTLALMDERGLSPGTNTLGLVKDAIHVTRNGIFCKSCYCSHSSNDHPGLLLPPSPPLLNIFDLSDSSDDVGIELPPTASSLEPSVEMQDPIFRVLIKPRKHSRLATQPNSSELPLPPAAAADGPTASTWAQVLSVFFALDFLIIKKHHSEHLGTGAFSLLCVGFLDHQETRDFPDRLVMDVLITVWIQHEWCTGEWCRDSTCSYNPNDKKYWNKTDFRGKGCNDDTVLKLGKWIGGPRYFEEFVLCLGVTFISLLAW
ncbi:uncharacterized protein A4U43_C04F1490 [Asparagus officinalis]|uniref:Uncharacterized protein n=1 Tax=Asparagus officinalis TaxID=4686 RepID=A0A5P1EZ82_ASPOF|nr:uncharacterized protein A4U43_C04F1490 [Asparagus officinalis]